MTNATSPTFEVASTDPAFIVRLLRATSPGGPFTVVASAAGTAGTVGLTDLTLIPVGQVGPIDGTYHDEAAQVISAGAASDPSAPLSVRFDNIKPAAPAGTAEPGTTIGLYAVQPNGTDQGLGTAPATNGTFTIRSAPLRYGKVTLVAQAVDLANNSGPIGPSTALRIVTVAGDHAGTGSARLAVFRPTSSGGTDDSESYLVRGTTPARVDTTPGRDIPVRSDLDGDGRIDLVAHRFGEATASGTRSVAGAYSSQFGPGGVGLPVPGNDAGIGPDVLAEYRPYNATWYVALPAGGLVLPFGQPNGDIRVPAANDGNGTTEIATSRPSDDSFTVRTTAYNESIPLSRVAGFTYSKWATSPPRRITKASVGTSMPSTGRAPANSSS